MSRYFFNELTKIPKTTMRLIIEPSYDLMSKWAANYVVSRINEFNPTPERPFVLGCPTGSSPLGM